MDNSGVYNLAVIGVTTELSAQAQSAITGLDGMASVSLEAAFLYGSGGTSLSATVQTTFDGTIWRDVARFDFTTASATKVANVSAESSKLIAAYVALGSEGISDGFLGNSLRAVLTSTGTYVNTTFALRASVR